MKQAAKKRVRQVVNITLPPEIRAAGDELASKNNESLSQLISRLIELYAIHRKIATSFFDLEVLKEVAERCKMPSLELKIQQLLRRSIKLLISTDIEDTKNSFEDLSLRLKKVFDDVERLIPSGHSQWGVGSTPGELYFDKIRKKDTPADLQAQQETGNIIQSIGEDHEKTSEPTPLNQAEIVVAQPEPSTDPVGEILRKSIVPKRAAKESRKTPAASKDQTPQPTPRA